MCRRLGALGSDLIRVSPSCASGFSPYCTQCAQDVQRSWPGRPLRGRRRESLVRPLSRERTTALDAGGSGASKIIMFDISDVRLAMAKRTVATHVFTSTSPPADGSVGPLVFVREEAARICREAGVDLAGVDVVVEASAAASAMRQGVALVKAGGTCAHRRRRCHQARLTRLDRSAGRSRPGRDGIPDADARRQGDRRPRCSACPSLVVHAEHLQASFGTRSGASKQPSTSSSAVSSTSNPLSPSACRSARQARRSRSSERGRMSRS